MAKKSGRSVSIRIHKDGSMTLRSTGGVDLRKVVPHLFSTQESEPSTPSHPENEVSHEK